MKRSSDRILTTHCGSLARPEGLLEQMRARASGGAVDDASYDRTVRDAVLESVRHQVSCGLDVVCDGEQAKRGFASYVIERLDGFEARPGSRMSAFEAEMAAFPHYYDRYFSTAMYGSAAVAPASLVCTGAVSYRGQAAIARDLANLAAAFERSPAEEAFVTAVAPSGVGSNEHYDSDAEYLFAVANAMSVEYRAIVDAGFLLQIDDPYLSELLGDTRFEPAERQERASNYVEAVNAALAGIPEDRVRFHTCYGINEGPRVHDAALSEVLPYLLAINAGAYSFEAANPRHEHEYHVFETTKLPPGKILIPGVVTHSTNVVEHPDLVAERIGRFAALVGRENVIAGCDCGFSTQATFSPEIDPDVVWAKFDALAEGARLASGGLWA